MTYPNHCFLLQLCCWGNG